MVRCTSSDGSINAQILCYAEVADFGPPPNLLKSSATRDSSASDSDLPIHSSASFAPSESTKYIPRPWQCLLVRIPTHCRLLCLISTFSQIPGSAPLVQETAGLCKVRELSGRMSGDKARIRTGNMVEFQHDLGRS